MAAQIRFVTARDAAAIAEIYAPSVLSTAFTFETEPPDTREFETRIAKITKTHPWFVAEENGIVLGYAYGSPHRERAAYRWSVECSVYVREGHHGKGIARALYTRLFETLRRQGFVNVYAGITLPNVPSVRTHESFGFKPIGVYPHIGYKLGQWHDVGWWELTLSAPTTQPPEPKPITELTI